MGTFTDKDSNYITKNHIGFIDVVDTLILILYVMYMLLNTKRFLNYEYGMGEDFALYLLVVRCVLLGIIAVKVIYYLASHPIYSFASILLFAWIIVLYEAKSEWDLSFADIMKSLLVFVVLMIIAMYKIPFHRIIKAYLIALGTFFVIRILGTFTKILPSNHYLIEGRGELNDFGFGHHNATLLVFFFIAMAWLYIIRGKQSIEKIIHCIIISVATLFLFLYTTSRTSTIIVLGICLSVIVYQLIQLKLPQLKIEKTVMVYVRKILLIGPVASVLITFAGMLFYNGYRHFVENPKFLTTMFQRFKCFSEDCALHGIRLPWQFVKESKCEGATFNWIIGDTSLTKYCDNLYHSLFINCGIIVFLLVVILFQYLAYKAYKRQDNITLLIIFGFSMLSIMEPTAMELTKNPFLMLAFATWDPTEASLVADESTRVSYKQQIKNTIGALGNKMYIVISAIVFYVALFPLMAVLCAYQIDTKDVSDYFFWWIVITVMLMYGFYLLAGGHRFEYVRVPSVKNRMRRYRSRIIISLAVLLIASVTAFVYTIQVSTYDVNTYDTRLDNGVALRDNVSYRQIIPINDSGLKKITLYFDSYGDRVADATLYLYNATKTMNALIRIDVSNPNENGALELDMSSGNFKQGQILCSEYVTNPNSWESPPVLNKIVYTFKESIPVLKCIMLCLPFYLIIDLIWIISSIVRIRMKK